MFPKILLILWVTCKMIYVHVEHDIRSENRILSTRHSVYIAILRRDSNMLYRVTFFVYRM